MTFKQADKHWLDEEYPGVTSQPQSCQQLGFQKEHISPLYHVQKRTFQDKHTGVNVTNAYWERGLLLQDLATNIHDLQTSGLLNSHASRYTTTNVGHMHGDRSSVITLGQLQELGFLDHLNTMAQADVIEKFADAANALSKNSHLSADQKQRAEALADKLNAATQKFVEAHADQAALMELKEKHCRFAWLKSTRYLCR